MIKFSLAEIAKQLGYQAPTRDVIFEGISKDTRTLKPRNLYVAIKGENFDGHDYIKEAANKWAAAAIVDRAMDIDIPQLIVKDTVEAFGKITEFWRDQFELTIVGVTGSNGKTTLKNMIASILTVACNNDPKQVLATQGNLNNFVGVPLMMAQLNAEHRMAVFEMGMNQFGEISYLTNLVKPKVAVITNAAESHLEGLGSIAGVAKAKGEIFEGLQPNGTAVLNQDDAHFNYWRGLLGERSYLTFGFEKSPDVTAVMNGEQFTLVTPKGKIDIQLSLLGKHNIMNALAAAACATALNLSLNTMKTGLEAVKPAPGRMHQYLLSNGTRLIDDTYNANPFSTLAAIQTLKTLEGNKVLVLADMKELGDDTKEMHYLTGQRIKEAGIDHLFTFGKLSEETAKGYGDGAKHFTDKDQLLTALEPYLKKGTVLLIKGSRSMKMEYLVEKLVPHDQLEHAH